MYLQRQSSFEVFVMHAEPLLRLGICAALREEPGMVVRCGPPLQDSAAPPPQDLDVIVADYDAAMDLSLIHI